MRTKVVHVVGHIQLDRASFRAAAKIERDALPPLCCARRLYARNHTSKEMQEPLGLKLCAFFFLKLEMHASRNLLTASSDRVDPYTKFNA